MVSLSKKSERKTGLIMTKQHFTLAEFKKIYSKVPRLCVDLVILNNEKKVLLTKRAIEPALGQWHLPGGTLIYSETINQAATRVADDELSVQIEIIKQIGIVEFLDPKTTNGGHSVSIQLLCQIKEGEIILNEQATEYDYFNPVPEDTIKEHKEFLTTYLSIDH
jgi:ADP-ribose pyrophosphatase YjhB (NUDIX family)